MRKSSFNRAALFVTAAAVQLLAAGGEAVAQQADAGDAISALLLGARGRQPADVKALATMLARLSVFAHQAGSAIQSIDLNPVFAMPEGQGAFAADAVIEIGS